ncbi:hypothetical protein [Bacteroides sp. 519]|uniref:hypothetical protein n=1 Tax=Bacteroides sp. 519 TaxID=2302937 RepID=UPI0013D6968E|nr:hypothetical protein [Bacteroides sp. 519]NDV59511.1 hypothetical protein [Bacteroides sp. 519]
MNKIFFLHFFLLFIILQITACTPKGIEGRWVAKDGSYIFLHEDGRFDASLHSDDSYFYGDWAIEDDTILVLEGQASRRLKNDLNRYLGLGTSSYTVYKLKGYTNDSLYLDMYNNTTGNYLKEYQYHETPDVYPITFARQKVKPVEPELQYWTKERNLWRNQSEDMEHPLMSHERKNREALRFAISYLTYYTQVQKIEAPLSAIVLPLHPTKGAGYSYFDSHRFGEVSGNWNTIYDSRGVAAEAAWYFRWIYEHTDVDVLVDSVEGLNEKLLFTLEYYLENLGKAEAERARLKQLYEEDTIRDTIPLLRFEVSPAKKLKTRQDIIDALNYRIDLEIKKMKLYRTMFSDFGFFGYLPFKIPYSKEIEKKNEVYDDWWLTFEDKHSIAITMLYEAFDQVVAKPREEYMYIEDRYIDIMEQIKRNLK